MICTRLVLPAVLLGGLLSAQTPVTTPDPIFLRSEGAGTATSFGAYADARHQLIDGNQGGSTMTIKELQFRHDDRDYNVMNGMGRTWNSVVIDMSEGALAGVGMTYSTNSSTTPSRVFGGQVNWPIQLGPTPFVPAPAAMRFPFARAWAYSGLRDIVVDFRFSGGVLANNAAWTGSRPYYLDSFGIGSFAPAPSTSFGHTNGGCADSGAPSNQAATVTFDSVTYGPNMASTVFRNKVFLRATGENFAKSAPVVLAMAFLTNPAGVRFPGVDCNDVFLHPSRLWFLHPLSTNSVGQILPYSFGLPAGLLPYSQTFPGVNLVVQGVWNDSRTGALKFSTASRTSLVAHSYSSPSAVRMKAARGTSSTSPNGSVVSEGEPADIPIFSYIK